MTSPQPYRIEVSGEARRGLHRLPGKIAAAMITFITGPLAEDPMRLSKPLSVELSDYRSARRGDYRVLIKVVADDRTVLVIRIAHRADVYR